MRPMPRRTKYTVPDGTNTTVMWSMNMVIRAMSFR